MESRSRDQGCELEVHEVQSEIYKKDPESGVGVPCHQAGFTVCEESERGREESGEWEVVVVGVLAETKRGVGVKDVRKCAGDDYRGVKKLLKNGDDGPR